MAAVVELRCPRHKHAELVGAVLVVKCGWCSKFAGRPVYHRWRLTIGPAGLVIAEAA